MILGYNEIVRYIDQYALLTNVDYNNINAASVDLTLAAEALIESDFAFPATIDLARKEVPHFGPVTLNYNGYELKPGHMIICSTREIFNLPDDIAAEFRLKSSASRCGLNLCLGLHCDPGWHGSTLSFTLINQTRRTTMRLQAEMKIGQVIFRKVAGDIPEEKSYAVQGQYNNTTGVTGSRGIR